MPLTNQQKSLLKRAQREAGLNDQEYRDILDTCTGARTSTAPELGDTHLDTLMKYIEAIYWRKRDSASVPSPPAGLSSCSDSGSHPRASASICGSRNPIFSRRDYWKNKNVRGNTSRDRYISNNIDTEIRALESQILRIIPNPNYLGAIKSNCITGIYDPPRPEELAGYRAALIRTLAWKRKGPQPRSSRRQEALTELQSSNQPF